MQTQALLGVALIPWILCGLAWFPMHRGPALRNVGLCMQGLGFGDGRSRILGELFAVKNSWSKDLGFGFDDLGFSVLCRQEILLILNVQEATLVLRLQTTMGRPTYAPQG